MKRWVWMQVREGKKNSMAYVVVRVSVRQVTRIFSTSNGNFLNIAVAMNEGCRGEENGEGTESRGKHCERHKSVGLYFRI